MKHILILVAVVLVGAAPARADVQVGVIVTGEPTLQPQLAAEVEGWLKQHSITVVPSAIDPESINAMIDCFVVEDLACAKKIVDDKAKAPSLVFVRVDASPGPNNTRDITLTGYWFDKGHDAVNDKRVCEKCADAKARAEADALVEHLAVLGKHEGGHLKLTSTPGGARALADGKPIGVTPVEADLAPGDHMLELAIGDRVTKRLVSIRNGETTTVDVPMPTAGGHGGSKLIPVAVIATGAAMLITGGVLIAVNQEPDANRNPQPEQLRDTKGLGIGVGIAGLAVGGVGAYLWVRAGHKNSDVTPVVAVDPHGAYVGWARSF